MEKTFESAAQRIAELTKASRNDEGEVMLCYLEELGELCQEIEIAMGVMGKQYKQPGPDGVYGECADVWICAVSHQYALYNQPLFCNPQSIEPISLKDFKSGLGKGSHFGTFSFQHWLAGLALSINDDKQCFCDKIHQKLDKWQLNVNKAKGLLEAVKEFQSDDYVMSEAEAAALSGPPNYPKIQPKSLPKRYRRWRV